MAAAAIGTAMQGKKDLLIRTLSGTGADRLLRAAGAWRGLLVLNYHRIGNPLSAPGDRGVYSASVDAFDQQVRWLKENAEIVAPDDLESLQPALRGRSVMITFDDGYADNYEAAFPVLRARRVPATFFLTSGFLDDGRSAWWDEIAWMARHGRRRDVLPPGPFTTEPLPLDEDGHTEASIRELLRVYKRLRVDQTKPFLDWLARESGAGRRTQAPPGVWMTWDNVRDMRRGGMTIGGHTVSHPILGRLAPDEQWSEISGCKERIEAELGEPITAFSYPVGSRDAFDNCTRECLTRAGFRWGFSFSGGYARPGRLDAHDIPRAAVEHDLPPSRFRAMLTLPQLFA
jgi:peptidoglycan/xylan/chitin deacetylase (PgdA/CDA1 family)